MLAIALSVAGGIILLVAAILLLLFKRRRRIFTNFNKISSSMEKVQKSGKKTKITSNKHTNNN